MSLGKGLGSLIPPKTSPTQVASEARASEHQDAHTGILEVEVNKIKPNPYQPRRQFDHWELEDLVKSIKEHGLLQPVVVTQEGDGYQLIAGERRLKSSKLAGLKKIPVIVRTASDLEKLELALIENIQRSDLNPVEKAEGYQKLLDEFGLTQDQAAKKMGIPRSTLANTLRFLELPAEVLKGLGDKKISEGHAKVLLSLDGPLEQSKVYKVIIQQKLSVRDLEQYIVTNKPALKNKKKPAKQSIDPQVMAYEDELQDALQTPVKINKKGESGYIKIDFYSSAELNSLIKKIS